MAILGYPYPQEERQDSDYPNQPAGFIPDPMQVDPNFLKYRIDSSDVIKEIEHILKGEEYIMKDGKMQWVKLNSRWLNDEGVGYIKGILNNYNNKTTYLANYPTELIALKVMKIHKVLAHLLFLKHRKYQIDSRPHRNIIVRMVKDDVHASLSRSEDALESTQLSTQSQQSHIIHEMKKEQGGGMMSKFNPFKMN